MTVLDGMAQITDYYGFSAPTILALIRHRGFPAEKLSGGASVQLRRPGAVDRGEPGYH